MRLFDFRRLSGEAYTCEWHVGFEAMRPHIISFGLMFLLGYWPNPLHAAGVDYPAVGVWNGFHNHLNVVECTNFGGTYAALKLTLRSNAGSELATQRFNVSGEGATHIILNDLASLTDSYGTFRLELQSGSETFADYIRCLTLVYRLSNAGATKAVSYAFSLPIENPSVGTSYGLFNSMNPSLETTPTYNWLSIYNPGTVNFNATIDRFRANGSLLSSTEVQALRPGERRDFALGHDSEENNGQVVGLYRITPQNPTQTYGAFLTRYGTRAGEFNFAFPLRPSTGACIDAPVPASTMDPAINWGELANVSDTNLTTRVTVRDISGAIVEERSAIIPPFGQYHFLLNQFIGSRTIGQFQVSCTDEDQLLVQSLYYGTNSESDPQVRWAYGTQITAAHSATDSVVAFPVNTFLGMANWIKLVEQDGENSELSLSLFSESLEETLSIPQSLPAFAPRDIGAHQYLAADSIGGVLIRPTGQAVFSSELLRVFPEQTGGIGYISRIPSATVSDANVEIELVRLTSGLSAPLALVAPPDGSDRLFVVEKVGRIKILSNGAVLGTPFLDLTAQVDTESERGLLGLAFHPEYETNRKFYLHYTANDGTITVSEFLASVGDANIADASSERILIEEPHPGLNHNGGQLQFGPDGYLYIAIGDGGAPGDPARNAQDLSDLLGSILRIDVNSGTPYTIPTNNPFVNQAGALPEIYAYGFRNPWRFSFDRGTGRLFVGDVGENSYEEVNLVTRGGNYGWNYREGDSCFSPSTNCPSSGFIDPIYAYPHSEGIAVIGGYLYRGTSIPALQGKYIFGDYGFSKIWALSERSPGEWVRTELMETTFFISSFAEDANGELYVLDINGRIYRISAP